MNEQIVAIGGPGLYPEYKGYKSMADRREKEEDKPNGERGRRREVEGRTRAKRDEEERSQRAKDLERERGEVAESMRRTTEEVRKTLEVARARQEVQQEPAVEKREAEGEKVPTLVESFPHLVNATRQQAIDVLQAEGVSVDLPGNWDGMDHVQKEAWLGGNKIVNVTKLPNVEAQEKGEIKYEDRKKGVAVIKEGDGRWAIMGRVDMREGTIKDLLKRAGAQVKLEFPRHWDQMGVGEQRDFLRRNGVEVVAGIGGGALQWADNLNEKEVPIDEVLRRLSLLAQQRADDPAGYAVGHWEDWGELLPRLNAKISELTSVKGEGAVGKVNYRELNELVSQAETLQKSFESQGQIAELDTFLPAATREELGQAREELDQVYQVRYDSLDDATKAGLFGDLESTVGTLATNAESGWWQGLDEAEARINRAIAPHLAKEAPRIRGILGWRATKLYELLKQKLVTDLLVKPPADPSESPARLNEVLRRIESTDFSPDQLEGMRQDAQRILARISTDTADGRKMFEEESKTLKAVQAFQIFRVTMEQADMNPEKVMNAFTGFDDETFKLYFERFNQDSKKREFEDSHGHKFNLLDKGLNVFFKRIHDEREKMNLVEELSRYDLSRSLIDKHGEIASRRGWRSLTPEQKALLAQLRQEFERRAQGLITKKDLKDDRGNPLTVDEVWRNLGHKNELIKDWYRETTLMGAHGARDTDGKKYLDLRKFGEDGKGELKGELMQRLRDLGYGDDRLIEYDKTGLLDQVINNSYYFAWTFAWSDYDGIRIWDHNAEGIHGKGRWSGFAFNQNTHMFYGRNIDHTWEHFYSQEEQRGKVGKTNMVFQEALLGREGALLPQNRTMVRFAKRFLRTDKDTLGLLEKRIGEKMKTMRNIDKFDLSVPEEKGWAENAALAEIMDDAEISFENVRFSEAFGKEESHVSKFAMIDLFADRAAHLKYMGPEELQMYLQGPNTKKFFEINSVEKFYSKREVRIKPWMKLVIPVHQELGKYWKKWWKLPYKMPHAEAEEMINYAAETNRLDARDHGRMKFRYCGWGPIPGVWGVRHIRQFAETAGLVSVESGKMLWMIPFLILWEYFRQSFGQTKDILQGK